MMDMFAAEAQSSNFWDFVMQYPYLAAGLLVALFIPTLFLVSRTGIKVGSWVLIKSKAERAEGRTLLEVMRYYMQPDYIEKVGDNYIGFYVEKVPKIRLWGTVWRTEDHYAIIDKLRALWTTQDSISVIESSVPSDIMGLIHEKLDELPHLEIHCTLAQAPLLKGWFKEHIDAGQVKIKER